MDVVKVNNQLTSSNGYHRYAGWAFLKQLKGLKSRTEVLQRKKKSAYGEQLVSRSSSMPFLMACPMGSGLASPAPQS